MGPYFDKPFNKIMKMRLALRSKKEVMTLIPAKAKKHIKQGLDFNEKAAKSSLRILLRTFIFAHSCDVLVNTRNKQGCGKRRARGGEGCASLVEFSVQVGGAESPLRF